MLQSRKEAREGKLQMLLSPRKKGLDSLFTEAWGFQGLQKIGLDLGAANLLFGPK